MLNAENLPVIFVGLMGLAIFVYAILDGYDLGVGILLPTGAGDINASQRTVMISSIGPFWDANETWLVLAVGLLLIAFPKAYGIILFHLYLPITFMLIGLILRGVAFDFRAKAVVEHRDHWDKAFRFGSVLTTLMQGYMLGLYVMGFSDSWAAQAFAILSALGVTMAYSYIGAAWLVMKTEGALQQRAILWAHRAGRLTLLGIILVSVVNVWVNPSVFEKWFSMPLVMFVLLIPVACISLFIANDIILARLPKINDRHCWLPFVNTLVIFLLSFSGLAFSFFPYIVPNEMDIWQAASAPESLAFIFWGAVLVVPMILLYTTYLYKVFWGKATQLKYY